MLAFITRLKNVYGWWIKTKIFILREIILILDLIQSKAGHKPYSCIAQNSIVCERMEQRNCNVYWGNLLSLFWKLLSHQWKSLLAWMDTTTCIANPNVLVSKKVIVDP